jgi:hypothetical protein
MAVYAVITAKPEPLVDAMLASQYAGKFYRFSDQAWIVATQDSAPELSVKLGGKQKLPNGTLQGALDGYILVSDLGPNYWGFSGTAFWTWLKNAHEGRL